jgi:pentatricopeptide repeat protein
MFRKGKALGEQGYFEKAEKILEQLKAESAEGVEYISPVLLW